METVCKSGTTDIPEQGTDVDNNTMTIRHLNQHKDSQNNTATAAIGQNQQLDGQNDTATAIGQNQQTDSQNDTATVIGQNQQIDGQNDTAIGNNKDISLGSFRSKATFCIKHKHSYVSLFCRTCDRLLCASCTIHGDHSNHNFCEISHVEKEKQHQLREVVGNMGKQMCEQACNRIKAMTQDKEAMTQMCERVKKEISAQKTTLMQQLDRWDKKSQKMVEDYQSKHICCLDERIKQSDTCLALLKLFLEDPDSIDRIDKTKSIQMLEILNDITNPEKEQGTKPDMTFLPGSGLGDENLDIIFGCLGVGTCETSVSDKREDAIPQGNSVCVESDEMVGSDQDSTDTESLYEDAPGSETMYKCTKRSIDRIAPVDPTTAFIVTKYNLYLVDFSKHRGDIENDTPLMTNVKHITPVTEKGIYVQQIGANSNLVTRVTTTGKQYRFLECTGETLRCLGLSNNGQVIIYTEKNFNDSRGTVRDLSFYDQDSIRRIPTFNRRLEWSFYVKNVADIVMTTSAIYILNSNPPEFKTSHIYRKVVDLLRNIKYEGAIGKDPASQFHPTGMCKDKDDRLIVTDYWNHAVHLLTSEGKFSKFLMREEDGLSYPTAVAMDNYRYLWIGQRDGTIHIIRYLP